MSRVLIVIEYFIADKTWTGKKGEEKAERKGTWMQYILQLPLVIYIYFLVIQYQVIVKHISGENKDTNQLRNINTNLEMYKQSDLLNCLLDSA